MKRFVSVYQSFFLAKTPIVLVVLILLGSIVGGSLILHSMNRASTVGSCSSSTVQYSTSSTLQSCANLTSHNQLQETRQTNHILQGEVIGPELLSIPRQIAPTPIPQPVKIIPTPLPTIPVPLKVFFKSSIQVPGGAHPRHQALPILRWRIHLQHIRFSCEMAIAGVSGHAFPSH